MEQTLHRINELDEKMTLIISLLNGQKDMAKTDQRFSVMELAQYLCCSQVTINRYVKENLITYHRINRTLYFLKSEIDMESSSKRTKFRVAC